VLEVTFSSRYALIGVIGFLITTVVAGYYSNVMRTLPLPFLATLGALLSILNGGLGRCSSATTGGLFHAAKDEGGPSRLLARGVSSCDVE
jgi:hypothetical protein